MTTASNRRQRRTTRFRAPFLGLMLAAAAAFAPSLALAAGAPPDEVNSQVGVEGEAPATFGINDSNEDVGANSGARSHGPGDSQQSDLNSQNDAENGSTEDGTSEEETQSGPSKQSTRAAPMSAGARSATGCSYANPNTGAYAETLCWIDMSGFTTEYKRSGSWLNYRYTPSLGVQYAPGGVVQTSAYSGGGRYWGPIANYPIEVDLGGGYTLTAKLTTGASATSQALALEAHGFPTWENEAPPYDGAFLGRNNFYTGVSGKPALNQPIDQGQPGPNASAKRYAEINLHDIKLSGPGQPNITDFSIVVADAESTDAGESIRWETDGRGFEWLPNTPSAGAPASKHDVMGNACTRATPTWNSTTPSPEASCVGGPSDDRDGTAMLATRPKTTANAPFEVSAKMVGSGKEAVAFGVITGRIGGTVEVDDRVRLADGEPASDDFVLGGSIDQTQLAELRTGTSGKKAEISQSFPVSSGELDVAFWSKIETVAGTPQPWHASYLTQWRCYKTVPYQDDAIWWPDDSDPEAFSTTAPDPSNQRDKDFLELKPAEYIHCGVKYVPPYLKLQKEVVDDTGLAAGFPDSLSTTNWLLKATPLAGALGPEFSRASYTVRTPLPAGSYGISESPVEGFQAAAGFEEVEWDCGDATVTEGGAGGRSVDVRPGEDVLCTVTNRTMPGSISWTKVAQERPEEFLKGSKWALTGPSVPAGTEVVDCVEVPCPAGDYKDQNPSPGEFELEGLPWGTYGVREVQAPAGYVLDASLRNAIIGENGTEFELMADLGKLGNQQQTAPSLPLTGGISADHFYVLMGLLGAVAGGGYLLKRVRDESLLKGTGGAHR